MAEIATPIFGYKNHINTDRHHGFIQMVRHRRRPPRRARTGRAAGQGEHRFGVEHPFAEIKSRMGLFVRTIGIDRATAKIGMANIAFNMKRLIFWERKSAIA